MFPVKALLSGLTYVFRPTVVLPGPTAPLDSGEVAGVCRVWRLPLAHRTVILHSSLALCLMSGNLPSELHPHPPYRYLLCIVSWPFQSMSSLIANQYCVVMLLGVALNLS